MQDRLLLSKRGLVTLTKILWRRAHGVWPGPELAIYRLDEDPQNFQVGNLILRPPGRRSGQNMSQPRLASPIKGIRQTPLRNYCVHVYDPVHKKSCYLGMRTTLEEAVALKTAFIHGEVTNASEQKKRRTLASNARKASLQVVPPPPVPDQAHLALFPSEDLTEELWWRVLPDSALNPQLRRILILRLRGLLRRFHLNHVQPGEQP